MLQNQMVARWTVTVGLKAIDLDEQSTGLSDCHVYRTRHALLPVHLIGFANMGKVVSHLARNNCLSCLMVIAQDNFAAPYCKKYSVTLFDLRTKLSTWKLSETT